MTGSQLLRRLLAGVAVALLGPGMTSGPAVAAPPSGAQAYTYAALHPSSVSAIATIERSPPGTSADLTTNHAVERRSNGISTRHHDRAAVASHGYNDVCRLKPGDSVTSASQGVPVEGHQRPRLAGVAAEGGADAARLGETVSPVGAPWSPWVVPTRRRPTSAM